MTETEFIKTENLTKTKTAIQIVRDISNYSLSEKNQEKIKVVISELCEIRDTLQGEINTTLD